MHPLCHTCTQYYKSRACPILVLIIESNIRKHVSYHKEKDPLETISISILATRFGHLWLERSCCVVLCEFTIMYATRPLQPLSFFSVHSWIFITVRIGCCTVLKRYTKLGTLWTCFSLSCIIQIKENLKLLSMEFKFKFKFKLQISSFQQSDKSYEMFPSDRIKRFSSDKSYLVILSLVIVVLFFFKFVNTEVRIE